MSQTVLGQHLAPHRPAGGDSRVSGDALEVAIGEQTLGERREGDATGADLLQRVEQAVVLDPPIDHRVRRLVDEQRGSELGEDRRGLPRARRVVRRDAGVQRPSGAHRGVERSHRLLQRRVRIDSMRVEDVDVVEAHAGQRLVERRQQVLPRPPVAVGTRPHVVAGLRRDDQFVAVRRQIVDEHAAEVHLRRSIRRPVVVGEVEVGDCRGRTPAARSPVACRRGGRGRSCATGRATGRAACSPLRPQRRYSIVSYRSSAAR